MGTDVEVASLPYATSEVEVHLRSGVILCLFVGVLSVASAECLRFAVFCAFANVTSSTASSMVMLSSVSSAIVVVFVSSRLEVEEAVEKDEEEGLLFDVTEAVSLLCLLFGDLKGERGGSSRMSGHDFHG